MQVESNATENVEEFTSENELLNYLNEGETPEETVKPTETPTEELPTEEVLNPELPTIGESGLETAAEKQPEEEDDKSETTQADEKEFSNIVEYLNDAQDLGLNVSELPEDLTRAQEAEVIADLFEKTVTESNKQLEEFKEVSALLEDKEVAAFLEAKRQGATLKDFVEAIKDSPTTMSDEAVMQGNLKSQYPDMTDDDIKDVIEDYKTKGILEKMAGATRERMIAQEEQRQEYESNLEKETYQKEVQGLGQLLEGTSSVYDVPLTDKMKSDVFLAATQRDDKGMTYLDNALQSNEGVANASINTNKRNKKLVEKLFENPLDLQSNSENSQDAPKFNSNAANSF